MSRMLQIYRLEFSRECSELKMILASAQTKPKRNTIDANLVDHYRLIEIAVENNADLILFPEMSITGYEREDAAAQAFSLNDPRIEKLKALASKKKIVIIAGAPVLLPTGLIIGSFIFSPDSAVSLYAKQFLHESETDYFTPSFDYNPTIELQGNRISLAICADIDHPEHSQSAHGTGSTIYLASIFFSPNGIPEAHVKLGGYAQKYSMNILMSNFGGESWGRPSGGRSAFWNNKGNLIATMKVSGSGLLLVEKNNDIWTEKIIYDT
jgi:predicted amidohydrolase